MQELYFVGFGSILYGIVNLNQAVQNLMPIFLFLARILFGVYSFQIMNKENINIIYSKIKDDWCQEYDDDQNPQGLAFNLPKFSLSYSDKSIIPSFSFSLPRYVFYKVPYERYITIYTTSSYLNRVLLERNNTLTKTNLNVKPKDSTYEQLNDSQNTENNDTSPSNKGTNDSSQINEIHYMCRTGGTDYIRYKMRKMSVTKYRFNKIQTHMYEQIMTHYNQHNNSVSFIEGKIGTGKTCFAYLLANELSATFVETFNPTEPSDSFDNLYTTCQHSPTQPLVVLLDEIDVMLQQITNGIPPHKNNLIQIRNKNHWNSFLDKIQLGCYPNLILIMCSNKSRESISKKMDPSYIRDGRVNHHFTINELA